jgi:glycopeptide antibiotics resistance protein
MPLFFLYRVLCIIGPCFLYQFIRARKNKISISKFHWLWVYIFLAYIYLVLVVVGIGSIWDIGEYDTVFRASEINLIPLQSDGFRTYALNTVLFIPLGFLLPTIWSKFRKIGNVICMGAGFSFAIEVCQLFNHRTSDIDDLLMNILGSLAGYCIWLMFSKLINNKKPGHEEKLSEYEAETYVVLAILGDFFLFNWRLLV